MKDYGDIYWEADDHAFKCDCPSCEASGTMRTEEDGDMICESCGYCCNGELQSKWIEKLMQEEAGLEWEPDYL